MIVQALVLLLHFALFSFEGADRSSATHTWPVGQAAKTAASHAANVGSIPARVTISHAPLAQLVEQLTLNQWVPGSNP